MDRSIIGLVGAASALALSGAADAAATQPASAPPARSYAELLDPIPGAADILRGQRKDAERRPATGETPLQLAQVMIPVPMPGPGYHHHHHHHHQGWYGWQHDPRYRHHHHHHHHHHYYQEY